MALIEHPNTVRALAREKHAWSLLWAARFVGKWEGFEAEAYWDQWANVWTIGFGHTKFAGPPFPHQGMIISRERAERILADDLRESARSVQRVCNELGVKPTVRQRIALISGVFNCGPGILDDPDIRAPLRRGNWKRVAREWQDWVHAGGEVVQGLVNRRRDEAWMMLHSNRPRRAPEPPKLHRARPVRAEKRR